MSIVTVTPPATPCNHGHWICTQANCDGYHHYYVAKSSPAGRRARAAARLDAR